MVRTAFGVLFCAVICLVASGVAWSRAKTVAAAVTAPDATLARFEATHRATEIDVATQYAGRLDLLDPRLALPTWHRYDRDEAVFVYDAASRCPPPASWVRDHVDEFHVLELAALDAGALPAERRGLAALPVEAATAGPVEATAPGALTAAHRAYLEGGYLALGERVREVLLDPTATALAKDNASALLDKAYEVKKGALPSRFEPPAGYQKLQYVCRRFAGPNGPYYQLRFAGSTRDASHLIGLTVRRLPDETLMDKATGKGTFGIRHDGFSRSQGLEEFVIDSEPLERPPADGVISLRLELDDGRVSEGFVLTRDLTPMTDPEITSPTPSETVSDSNPLVRWTTPRAPSQASFERRRTTIHVTRNGEAQSLWEFTGGRAAGAEEVRIGSAAGSSETKLTPGNYWVSVSAVESRSFGPVELLRASRSSRPFDVVE